MKKTLALIILLFLSLAFSTVCRANIAVQPLELSITMDNEFIHGNTSKKIAITNNNDYSINVTWYLEHPNPISWMRPNKTCIPSLSWIDVNPKWCIVLPDDSVAFYIYLDVPESEEHLEQHWETWVTFKQEPGGGIFNQEHAVRVYIDTPGEVAINNNQDQIPPSHVVIVAVVAISLFILGTLVYKKKKL